MEFITDIGLLLIRIGTGLLFFARGILSILGGSERWSQLGSRMAYLDVHSAFAFWGFLTAFLMACGGVFLLVGLRLRPVTVVLGCLCFLSLATQAGQEVGIIHIAYSLPALFILAGLFCTGAGPLSVDTYLANRNKQP